MDPWIAGGMRSMRSGRRFAPKVGHTRLRCGLISAWALRCLLVSRSGRSGLQLGVAELGAFLRRWHGLSYSVLRLEFTREPLPHVRLPPNEVLSLGSLTKPPVPH